MKKTKYQQSIIAELAKAYQCIIKVLSKLLLKLLIN